MRQVGSYEAKTHLPALLKRVKKGEKIKITRHGVAIAYLIPANSEEQISPSKVIEQIRSFRKKNKLGKLKLKNLMEEGRA